MAANFAIGKMEAHIRVRMVSEPNLQFSVANDRILTLDNSKGDDLQDVTINALEYYLDRLQVANGHAKIDTRNEIGGDIDFKHFDLKAGEVKHLDPAKEIRYVFLLNVHKPADSTLQAFDEMVHYFCLRFVFKKKDTGETFVHYEVISPYSSSNLAEHPEMSFGQHHPNPGDENFASSIARNIKSDARCYYGTSYREYAP